MSASKVSLSTSGSAVQDFYSGSTIFLTGATGFIGNLVLEKIVRSCENVKKIYILIRSKKGKDSDSRFNEIFDSPAWDVVKRKNPNFLKKISYIEGNCAHSGLSLSNDDKQMLINSADIIIHVAATVRFVETLSVAVKINVRCVEDLLGLARKMPQLKAFVYVSTAFSNCNKLDIEEKFYDCPIEPEKLIYLVENFDEEFCNNLTPQLMQDWPNTYTFTKNVAENLIKKKGTNLPIAIVRPSIVTNTNHEPIKGYSNQIFGINGLIVGIACGVIRVLKGGANNKLHVIPVDFVSNNIIVAALSANSNQSKQSKIPIYNCVLSHKVSITLVDFINTMYETGKIIPAKKTLWNPFVFIVSSNFAFNILYFFLHTIPAYLIDTLQPLISRKKHKNSLMGLYKKISTAIETTSYFILSDWNFDISNTRRLYENLNALDKNLFAFNPDEMHWNLYLDKYFMGLRIYLLKDPLETVPESLRNLKKLKIYHYVTIAILLFSIFSIIVQLFNKLF